MKTVFIRAEVRLLPDEISYNSAMTSIQGGDHSSLSECCMTEEKHTIFEGHPNGNLDSKLFGS